MSRLTALKHEIGEVARVTLFFFFCFVVMLTMKKLLLAHYQVEVSAVSTAAISALIIAKIVIVLDKTPAGKRFDARLALGAAALYKTLIYLLATFLVLFLEKLFHAYREYDDLAQALKAVWLQKDWNFMAGKLLWVGLTFLIYHIYAGLDRRLGEGRLRRVVFERPNQGNKR
jgi:hypothetical protein